MSDLISRAERFARVRHEGQFRKGKAKEPYTNHLVEVAALVERWSGSESAKQQLGCTTPSKTAHPPQWPS